MDNALQKQRLYWNSEYQSFDTIYTHRKSKFWTLLDNILRKDMYQRFEFTISNSEPIKGRTFLDVGCGTGYYSVEFAKRGARYVTGLDISENMVQASQERAKNNQVEDKCDFIQTDLLEYMANSKFDVTIGIGLFDYIKEPLPVIKMMKKVTKDKIIMSFPRLFTWRAPIRKFRLTFKKCDVFFYTKEEIKDLLHKAAFKKYKIEKVGKLYCVVAFCNNKKQRIRAGIREKISNIHNSKLPCNA